MADNSTAYAKVKIQGIDVSGSVSSVDVEDNDRLIDVATIVLDDPQEGASDVVREAQTVLIDLGWASEHAVLFEGVVVGVSPEVKGAGKSRLTVKAYDLSHKLMQGPPVPAANFTGKLSAILTSLVTKKSYGFTVGKIAPDPDPEFTVEKPLRQTNKHDWEFIQELALRYGARAYVEYNDGKSQFYFLPESQLLKADAMGKLKYCAGFSQLVEFKYHRVASGAAPSSTASTVDPRTGDVVSRSSDPLPPAAAVTMDQPTRDRLAQLSKGGGSDYATAVDVASKAGGKPEDQLPQSVKAGLASDADRAADAVRRDPTRILGYEGEGVAVGTVMLRAKGKVTIEGISPWAAGDWYVRQVHHQYSRATTTKPAEKQGDKPAVKVSTSYQSRFAVTR